MRILLMEPFFGGSHRLWAEGLRKFSRHEITLCTLPGRHWKWRMHGGALHMARHCRPSSGLTDLLLATDMLDLTTFLALTRHSLPGIPAALYFHENQLTYPWSPTDSDPSKERDRHYAFINFCSALAADRVFFNSEYHRRSFLEALPGFLQHFPDYREMDRIETLKEKCTVLPLGLDLSSLPEPEAAKPSPEAVLLWNHRWEYDKDPETFFRLLKRLQTADCPFKLVVLGKSFRKVPLIFDRIRSELADHILYMGYAKDRREYFRWLQRSDILPVTSRQDFFGASAVEAIYCNCFPLLPRRLAFPEHIPEAQQRHHLYSDEEDLYQRLSRAILNVNAIRQREYRHFVARYDWRNLITRYDAEFQRLSATDT